MRAALLKLLKQHGEAAGLMLPENLEAYTEKLLTHAALISYTDAGELAGCIAYYRNGLRQELAFLSLVLVQRHWQGQGIGKLLMEASVQDLKRCGFSAYALEMLKSNLRALNLYRRLGFEIKGRSGGKSGILATVCEPAGYSVDAVRSHNFNTRCYTSAVVNK